MTTFRRLCLDKGTNEGTRVCPHLSTCAHCRLHWCKNTDLTPCSNLHKTWCSSPAHM